MAPIKLEHVSKVYPNGADAVTDLSLEVEDGEFAILVGPSGCGKTTALRMVAGLEEITEGRIEVGGRVVNELTPRDRDVAMVFQNYALYPHMTVAENIGFALRLRRVPREEIRARVEQAAEVLGIGEHLKRKPAQLSGGQRQRVAMGRAIVREPAAFLMDEPLSNLDAKLRVQMRAEVLRIQRRVGVATLYVTHDQTEAMTMGDRVAVMRAGRLQQYDEPQALYDQPANLFVAAFIGSPPMNLYPARVDRDGRSVWIGEQRLELPERLRADSLIGEYRGKEVVVGVRPEDLSDAALEDGEAEGRRLEGTVELVEALGAEKLVHFRVDRVGEEGAVTQAAGNDGAPGIDVQAASVARVGPGSRARVQERVVFGVDVERVHLFGGEAGRGLGNPDQPR